MSTQSSAGAPETLSALAIRLRGEFKEMPGLRLTVRQAARLFSVGHDVAHTVLNELKRAAFLECTDDGVFFIDQ
jgi:hypothetical protein